MAREKKHVHRVQMTKGKRNIKYYEGHKCIYRMVFIFIVTAKIKDKLSNEHLIFCR